MARSARRPVPGPVAEPTARDLAPRSWQGIVYRPSPTGALDLRRLFHFAGAWVPPSAAGEMGWQADAEGRLVGGVLVERHGSHGFAHGPVVVEPPPDVGSLDVAAHLVAPLLELIPGPPLDTLFTRPQGLDRIWVRLGFVPMPEATLPAAFRDRPGTGLYAWRRPGTYAVPTPDAEARRRGRR
jgi:hypothetical protein